ncbi:hypothetical protein R1sor_008173 [Riccia sorocarpa]|uniref:FCP1 homology domain-containing protein n=1 Tax=Riccia sorocarpa TaxID=122646 RepID=A0ABD3HVG7_9MARC
MESCLLSILMNIKNHLSNLNAPGLLAQTSDGIDIDQVVDREIIESGAMNTKEADDQMSSDQRQDDQVVRIESGLLAPIETPISWVPDVNQVSNPLVKVSDLLPRKLLILDVEGLLVYAEGFMDRSSKTVAGDDVGAKKVIRRNGVQEFITRCLELFDIALWTCSDRNLLYDYTYYLFSREQYSKFLGGIRVRLWIQRRRGRATIETSGWS